MPIEYDEKAERIASLFMLIKEKLDNEEKSVHVKILVTQLLNLQHRLNMSTYELFKLIIWSFQDLQEYAAELEMLDKIEKKLQAREQNPKKQTHSKWKF